MNNGWKAKRDAAKQTLKRLSRKHIKTWYLAIVLILSIAGTVWGLRNNNLTMISLRDQVLKTDADNGNVHHALTNLSSYVFAHMNTTVDQLQLVNSYNRDVAKIANQSQKSTSNIYEQAQKACEKVGGDSDGYTTGVAQCAQDYVLTHMPKQQADIKYPDKSIYSYSFAAPVWSADFAGISLALAIISALWLASRLFVWLTAMMIVRYNNR